MYSSTCWEPKADELAQAAVRKGTAAAWQELLKYCTLMGYFLRVKVHARHIVICPCNRDGYGVNPADVHEILSDITEVGWSHDAFDGILTDVEADEKDEVCEYNEVQVAASGGMLAPIVRDEVDYMTLAGSHTNQGHRSRY